MTNDEENPNAEEDVPAGVVLPGDAGDKDLRPKVDSLMADGGGLAEALAEGAFGDPAGEETMAPTEIPRSVATEIIHTESQIGPFKLIEEIGTGGFGTVHLAEQTEPVERQVALKIIKLGMDSKEIIARFAAERQVLAMMDHPNIATVLDAGTTSSGRPYFVMELVKGIPITRYCDQNKLSTYERLQLFLQVCAAIQHAHQKGVIHRDIKPSNILVTTADGKPMVKVIDFGIAKALDQSGGEHTVLTMFGQIIGTPQYMSPEQADDTTHDIDTRSDIYSLGVLLYELLTGSTPICPEELRKAGVGEIQRIIRELQPRKPSTRVTGKNTDDESSVILTRGEAPQRVVQLLKGDLDWIVMKAIEKDRDRRYETARGLARDIECFLNNEPVSASPPTMFYLWGKFAARHRKLIASLSAIAMSLVVGVVGMTMLYFKAETNRQEAVLNLGIADAERKRAEAARQAEQMERSRAEAEAERRRRLLYASDMQLASQHWENSSGPAHAVAELLTAHVPGPAEEDLREFAWRHQWHALNRGSAVTVVEPDLLGIVALRDGTLATVSRQMMIRRWTGNQSKPVAEIDLGLAWEEGDLAQITPDGRRLVHVGKEKIRVFEMNSGRQVHDFPNAGRIVRMEVSADSKFLGLVAEETTRLRIIDLEGEAAAVSLPRLRITHPDFPIAIAPDREYVLGGNFAGNGVLSLVQPGRGTRRLPNGHRWSVRCLAWAPNGEMLASGDGSGLVILRRRDAQGEVVQCKPHSSRVTSLSFAAAGDLLASASLEGELCVIDTETGEVIKRFKGHTAEVSSLNFSADGRFLASASADGTARLWKLDAESGRSRLDIRYVGASIEEVDGRREVHFRGLANLDTNRLQILSGQIEPGARLVSVRSGDQPKQTLAELPAAMVLRLLQGQSEVTNTLEVLGAGGESRTVAFLYRNPRVGSRRMTFSADGRWFAATVGQRILVWDWKGPRPTWQLPVRGNAVAISHDSRLLAVNDLTDKTVQLWDLETRSKLDSWNWSPVGALAFSPDGRFLAASQGHQTVFSRTPISTNQTRIFGLVARRHRKLEGHGTWVSGVAFSPDSRHFVSGGHDGTVKIFRTSDWQQQVRSHPVNDRLVSLKYTPDGTLLVAGGWSGSVYVWNASSGELMDTLEGHSSIVTALDFSPDGRTLATSSSDRTIKLWGVRTRQLLRTFSGHENVVMGLAFARDGDALVTGASQGELFVWRASTLDTIAKHPLTINSMNNLAETYLRRGPFERATQLFEQVAAERAAQLGGNHVLTLDALVDLGRSLQKQEKWSDAMTIWETNLMSHLASLGAGAPRTIRLLDELTTLYAKRIETARADGRPTTAAEICERGLKHLQSALGINDVRMLPFLRLVGITRIETGDVDAAIQSFEQALSLVSDDEESESRADLQHDLGKALAARKEFDRAEKLLRSTVELRRNGDSAPEGVVESLSALAQMLMDRATENDLGEAKEICLQARTIRAPRAIHETVCRQLVQLSEYDRNLAGVNLWNGHAEYAAQRFEAAVPFYTKALELQIAELGESDAAIGKTRERLATVLRMVGNAAGKTGNFEKAAAFLSRSRQQQDLVSFFELRLAAALHASNQPDKLRRLLVDMLDRYESGRRSADRERVAKGVLVLMPESAILKRAVMLARKNHQERPSLIWPGIGLALAEIRSGNFQAAEACLSGLQPSPVHLEQRAMIDVCLAMAGMELGKDVSDLIRRSEQRIAEILPRPGQERDAWHDAIYVQALLEEAKSRLAGRK